MTRLSICLLALFCAAFAWAADLPITEVFLFSSGVGYVQRAGTVTDNTPCNSPSNPSRSTTC
jgi:hypothetical protein